MTSRNAIHRLSDPVPYDFDLPPSPTTRLVEPNALAGGACLSPQPQTFHELRSNASWAARISSDENVASSLESSQTLPSSVDSVGFPGPSSSHRTWIAPTPEDSKRQRQFSGSSDTQSPDKRIRFGVRGPSSYPVQDVSRQLQAIGVSSSSSLPGAFATPARNPSLRKDSLRSLTSPCGIRLDRAALSSTGFAAPRAPQLGKFDTPVCEYDGTPLGVGLGAFAGLRDGLALGRKNSLSRIIMDEGLARQLEVEKVGATHPTVGRRHASSLALGQSLHNGLDDTDMDECSSLTYIPSKDTVRRRPHPVVTTATTTKFMNELENALDNVNRAPVLPEPHQEAELNSIGLDEADHRTLQEERFIHEQVAAEQELAATVTTEQARPSKPKHVVTPSNKHMGFELDPAREVVPSDSSQESASMLSICVLAVESIWPQSRTRDDWSYRGTLNGQDGCAPSRGVLPLSHFVREVLRRSRTLANTLQISLYYLHQSRRAIRLRVALAEEAKRSYKALLASGKAGSPASCSEGQTEASDELQTIMQVMSDPVLCGRRMFLASLMCASKYLQDRNFSNRAWAKISGLPVKEVNANERTFLFLVEYRLHVDLETFNHWIVRLQKLADDKGTAPSKSNTTSPPVKASTKLPGSDAASSLPRSAPMATTPASNGASPADRFGSRQGAGVRRSFTESTVATDSTTTMGRATAAAPSRILRSTTVSDVGGAFNAAPSSYRPRRPTVVDTSASISVPTYSDLMAEREMTLAQRRRDEQEMQSLRAAERAATLTALRAREERVRQEERERNRHNSIRRAQRDRVEAIQRQQDQLAAASASSSYRRGYRPSTLASTAFPGDDDLERSDMEIDISTLRDRPPSSCGMQDATSALLNAGDFPGRNGHAMPVVDDYGHRLNHLNHHHHQYSLTNRWGAPPPVY